METVISALHFEWRDVQGCLHEAVDSLGLDGVEFSWHPSFSRPHCTREDLAALQRVTPRPGLHLSAHIWDNLPALGRDAGTDALRRWLDWCRKTPVRTLVVHGGSWDDQEAGVERTVDMLAEVSQEAVRAGVTICVENHYAFDYHDCHELFSEVWEFQRLFDAVTEGVAFCFDTGHGHLTGNWNEQLKVLAPHLKYVHLADNLGQIDDHKPFRMGTVPWDGMFELLTSVGFNGTFCVEFPVRENLSPFRECVSELNRRFR